MGFRRTCCKHCGQPLPRIAISKLDWVCRACGSRHRKPRWIDIIILVTAVFYFILLLVFSAAFYVFLFESVLAIDSAWAVGVCVVLTVTGGFVLYAYCFPYLDFHWLKEARPHCVKCMYPVEERAEACPECGEVVPWNHALPKAWTTIRFGTACCNCCGTAIPRSANYEKGGQWVCRGCGVTLVQPPHLYSISNSIQAVAMVIALLVGGVVSLVVMSNLFPGVLALIWFLAGAAAGLASVMAVHWLIFPYVSPYIVKDARVHCSACGIAVPMGMGQCPSCTRAVRYSHQVDMGSE